MSAYDLHDAAAFEVRRSGPGVEILSSTDKKPIAFVHGTTPEALQLAQCYALARTQVYAIKRGWEFLSQQSHLSVEGRTLMRLFAEVFKQSTGVRVETPN